MKNDSALIASLREDITAADANFAAQFATGVVSGRLRTGAAGSISVRGDLVGSSADFSGTVSFGSVKQLVVGGDLLGGMGKYSVPSSAASTPAPIPAGSMRSAIARSSGRTAQASGSIP